MAYVQSLLKKVPGEEYSKALKNTPDSSDLASTISGYGFL